MKKLTKEEFIEKFNKVQDTFQAAEQCVRSGVLEEYVEGISKFEYVIDEGREIMLYTFVYGGTAYMMDMLNRSILNVATSDNMIGCFDANLWADRLNDIIDFYQKAKLNNEIRFVSDYDFVLYSAYDVLRVSYIMKENTNEAISALQKAVELGSQGARVRLGILLYGMNDDAGSFKMLDSVDILSEDVRCELLFDEKLQALAMLILSDMYLRGVGGGEDIEKSYQILQQSLNHSYSKIDSENEILQMIREKLSHYKKGLFGGLRYIP